MVQVLVLIADGSEEMESVTVIDVLRRAKFNVLVAKVSNDQHHSDSLKVLGSRNVKLEADIQFDQSVADKEFDAIVLPGGQKGAETFAANDLLLNRLAKQRHSGKICAAICASPALVFSKHKILEGISKVTCYPSLKDKLTHAHEFVDEKVVVEKNVVTSQGPFTATHFAVKLIELLDSKHASDEVAKGLLLH